MDRLATICALMLLGVLNGCAICCNPYACHYAAYGGSRPRQDMIHGRVGSAFHDAGQVVTAGPFETEWDQNSEYEPDSDVESLPYRNDYDDSSFGDSEQGALESQDSSSESPDPNASGTSPLDEEDDREAFYDGFDTFQAPTGQADMLPMTESDTLPQDMPPGTVDAGDVTQAPMEIESTNDAPPIELPFIP